VFTLELGICGTLIYKLLTIFTFNLIQVQGVHQRRHSNRSRATRETQETTF
jgi:hypothetical protein